jgi:hypothetical protein
VLDEYVSVEGARRDYGVALRGSLAELDLEIDWPETERLRALARAKDAPATPYGAAPRAAAEASG